MTVTETSSSCPCSGVRTPKCYSQFILILNSYTSQNRIHVDTTWHCWRSLLGSPEPRSRVPPLVNKRQQWSPMEVFHWTLHHLRPSVPRALRASRLRTLRALRTLRTLRTSKWRCMATATLIAPLAGAMHCLQTRARSGAWRARCTRCTRCTRCMCHATASESVNIQAPHPGWRISHTTSFLWSLWLILMLLTVVCGLVDVWNPKGRKRSFQGDVVVTK